MAVRLVLSDVAEADIEAIGDYIALDSSQAAVRFVAHLRERCESLTTFPARGKPFGPRNRALLVGDYLIVYRAAQSGSDPLIEVIRVVHGARDLSALSGS